MEGMVRVAAVGVIAVVLSLMLRKYTPELALLLTLAAGVWMLSIVANTMSSTLDLLKELASLSVGEEELLRPVVKTVALSLVTRITADICRSGGEGGLAAFVETAGAVLILGISLPLMRAVMVLMGELLG